MDIGEERLSELKEISEEIIQNATKNKYKYRKYIFFEVKKSTQNAKECVFNMSYKSRHLKEWKREAIQRKYSWEFPKIDETWVLIFKKHKSEVR